MAYGLSSAMPIKHIRDLTEARALAWQDLIGQTQIQVPPTLHLPPQDHYLFLYTICKPPHPDNLRRSSKGQEDGKGQKNGNGIYFSVFRTVGM